MRSLLALAAVVASFAARAAAPLPDAVDLATVFQLVREVSPRAALERQAIAQAEADRITAGTYPNPTLNYGYFRPSSGQRTVFDGSRQQETTVEVPLLIAGQRGARIERAEREIEAARARVAAGTSTLSAEAGAAYVNLLAAQERAALLGSLRAEIVRLRDIVAGREASGAASRYDVARVDVELGGLQARQEDARAETADRSGMLAALLGLPNWRPVAMGPLAPLGVAVAGPARTDERARATPASRAAAREQAVAESAVEVAKRERWPVPAVGVGRTWTSDPYGAANFLGMHVELPLFDTRRGPLARAQADAHAAELRHGVVVAEAAANLQRLENVIVARRDALVRFEKDTAARLPALRQMAEDAYRLGRGGILELLDATRSRNEIERVRIDLAAGLLEAEARLIALTGETPRALQTR